MSRCASSPSILSLSLPLGRARSLFAGLSGLTESELRENGRGKSLFGPRIIKAGQKVFEGTRSAKRPRLLNRDVLVKDETGTKNLPRRALELDFVPFGIGRRYDKVDVRLIFRCNHVTYFFPKN